MEVIKLNLKKRLSIALLIIIVLVIVGYFGIIKNIISYQKISEDTKSKITSIIKGSKGEIPNLQTDSCKASWTDEAHIKQKEMMDKVLDTITILGESRKGKPNKYIIATFYDNMQLYIPYNEKKPQNNIVIEVDNHYFIATAKEDDVRTIISFMEKQLTIK